MANKENKTNKKILTGRVVSNKMDKTVVLKIIQKQRHRLYKKYVMKSKKIKAHDEKNECNMNDVVKVIESRPLSKDKCWRLLEIVERAK
jgi:small subunit ribosomal protein S17